MIPKEFDSIGKDDIDALVTNSVCERRTLEYKQQLPGNSDEEKREFLADASSFANAAGGDLIYGIREKRDSSGKATGLPEAAEGLQSINPDHEIRRLEEILRNGIDPRVPGLRLKHVDGFAVGPVIILRIPRSWNGPHMVVYKNLSRFFSRTSAGKHQLDVQEIRTAFTASQAVSDKLRHFRSERLGRILADETPVQLLANPKVILHLLPFTIADPSSQIDLTPLLEKPTKAAPLNAFGWASRINFDGLLTYTNYHQDVPTVSYLQIFRSGAFEAVNAELLTQPDGRKLIAQVKVELEIQKGLAQYMDVVKELGIPLPMVLLLTLHGIKGYTLLPNSPFAGFTSSNTIDREMLMLPDVLIDEVTTPVDVTLKPVFDAIWQAAGFVRCEHYNPQGRWDGGRSQLPRA